MATFERYERPYRRDFADITQELAGPKVDLFPRYEMMIYRMFENATRIHREAGAVVTTK